jgi:sn-glycerol 3-phosphate transport system substrate-binding protein
MKRALALLAVLLLTLGLAACGGGGEGGEAEGTATPSGATPSGTTPSSATPSGETVKIKFWHAMNAANQETLKRLTDRFNSSQSEVQVELQYQGTYEDNLAKLLASRASGDVPALIQLHDVSTQLLVDSGMITPVQDFIDAEDYDLSDFVQRTVDYYTVDSKLQGMPFNISNPILYYNKVHFREAGLDPEKPPQTLAELKEDCQKLTIRNASGATTRYCIALPIDPWYLEQLLAQGGDLYVNNGNGRDARATEAVFNSARGKEIFEWWGDLMKSGDGQNVGRNPTGDQHLLAVGAGQASMTIGTSAALRTAFDVLEAPGSIQLTDIELGTAPLPGFADGAGGSLVGGGALWILNQRSEKEQEAAWKYVKFLVEPEQQAEWYSGSGYFPMRISAYELPAAKEVEAKYPAFRTAVDPFLATASTRATQGALLGNFVDVRVIVQTAVEQMILKSKDPDQAVDDAAKEATEAIQEYNRRIGD